MSRSNMKYGRHSLFLSRWNYWDHLGVTSLALNLKINITINSSKLTASDTSLSWRYTNLWNVLRTDVWEAILHTVNWRDRDHRSCSPKINHLFHECVLVWCEVVSTLNKCSHTPGSHDTVLCGRSRQSLHQITWTWRHNFLLSCTSEWPQTRLKQPNCLSLILSQGVRTLFFIFFFLESRQLIIRHDSERWGSKSGWICVVWSWHMWEQK